MDESDCKHVCGCISTVFRRKTFGEPIIVVCVFSQVLRCIQVDILMMLDICIPDNVLAELNVVEVRESSRLTLFCGVPAGDPVHQGSTLEVDREHSFKVNIPGKPRIDFYRYTSGL